MNHLIECRDLVLGYEDGVVLENVTFFLSRGDYLVVLGDNGAGKSTLLKAILGLLPPLSGVLDKSGVKIGYLPQRSDVLLSFPASVMEVVLSGKIRELGTVNVNAVDEYRETKERYDFLSGQKADIMDAEEKLKGIIKDLSGLMERQFRENLEIISENFGEVFREMFGGGRAYLKVLDEDDILGSGIDIIAQPPGKNLQNMMLLSGGERALTAIAILFSILKMKPSPFCILDEIEAALDDANVQRFGDYLRRFSDDTQFIVITHRKGTMEAADVLYGVTMQEQGVSKIVSVKFDEAVIE